MYYVFTSYMASIRYSILDMEQHSLWKLVGRCMDVMKQFQKQIKKAQSQGKIGTVLLYGNKEINKAGVDVLEYNLDTNQVIVFHPYIDSLST